MSGVVEIEPLWTVHDVSAYIGVPVATIYQWRVRGEGPRAIRLGRHLRFERQAVVAWIEQQREAA
ncbi:helix-turn-helix domain-containing protein [Nocardioides sp. NPDC047086]|uniref:helix-turn-helix transcriptional regulator n=1 Tax=Nocardioides sp. NPDC047086 TaxID=3154810 RepID=UPI0033C74765